MAVTDPCKEKQPKVIDNDLIYKCIQSQFPKGEIGRLTREEPIPLDEVEEIRFEFANILKIDHLWVMTSLTKLQLNNNIIEKMENLECLVHLRELDLSFNKISKIENMDKLTQLIKLTFFDNLIETIENMDNLKNLTVFSIGRNKITNKNNVRYMRRFPKLTSLNMAHNPCAEVPNFRNYIGVFLPRLVYYEYIRLTSSERVEGNKIFKAELRELKNIDDEQNAVLEVKEKEKTDAELHALMFVEYLNSRHLFDQMFENDVEGKTLLELGDELKELFDEYEEQFIALCKLIFEIGHRHYKIRKVEVEEFLIAVEHGKKDNQKQSIAVMESFIKKKGKMYHHVKKIQKNYHNSLVDQEKYNQAIEIYSEECAKMIYETWKELMKLELQLYEQVEEVNQNFGHGLGDLINAFLEEAQAVVAQIRALEVNYSENIGDAVVKFQAAVNMNEAIEVPPKLVMIISDKDALHNTIGASHDLHMQIIDNREDILVNKAKNYVENFVENLLQEEIKRNRYKLLEINHFLDIQKEELLDVMDEYVLMEMEDLDI